MISVYVESKILRSHHKIHRNNRFRRDRRAQLLSYTHSAHAKPFHNLTPKSKKRRFRDRIRRLFCGFSRSRVKKRLWKYESAKGEAKWSYGRIDKFHLCKKLKCLLKKICVAWKCNNGSTDCI
ncbi:uncharacterized protein LOC121758652 [Salvia splendens]|uniref:uncharacterized protein LOC121758652 n=1 Tax=Salvia splendens TaxID=180675 RepID=UPI001C257762|nr:uncharacterized protein LOC121758652 [Salvia splendens]